MEKTIGFVGCGNIAKAMIGGFIKSGTIEPKNILVSAKRKESIEKTKHEFNINTSLDNKKVARESDYIFLAVKPFMYDEIIDEIREYIKPGSIVISLAAGISLKYMHEAFGNSIKVVRVMPNIPVMVGEGMTAISLDNCISENEINELMNLFNSIGKAEILDDSLMNAVTAVSGSTPAYIFMLIEAMSDAAVKEGIPRAQAYTLSAQSVLGSAKMVLESGLHPGQLKDNVCSPGGTAIAGVSSLEENGFRSAIIKVIKVVADRSREIGR